MYYEDYNYPPSTVPGDTTFLAVLAFFLAWTTLYFSLVLFCPRRQKSAEWHCRTVTVIHALLVVSMSAWCGFKQGPWPFTHPGGPVTTLQHWTIMICCAYFIFDLSWCLYFKTEGALMMFHHGVSLFGQFLCLSTGLYGTEMIATIFGTEITNPLLQLRWFLRESGLQQSWYAEVTDIAFMVSFSVFRIGLASYLLYTYVLHPRTDWIGRAGGATIYGIGWIFWIFIIRYAIRKYSKMYFAFRGSKSSPSKGVSLNGSGDSLANGKESPVPASEFPDGAGDSRNNGVVQDSDHSLKLAGNGIHKRR